MITQITQIRVISLPPTAEQRPARPASLRSVLTRLKGMRTPDVELLWWSGCPSTERAERELRDALRDVGLDRAQVRRREIGTDVEADEVGFRGSPTILIDGVDLLTASPQEPTGLSCRVYPRRDGRISPTPDPDDLREGLRRAAGVEVSR